MAYHLRQKLNYSSPSSVVLPELQTNERGRASYKMVDQSKRVLPDVETTDLRAMLDAGVPLKQVSTKLFSPESVVVDMSPEKIEQPTNKEGE